MSNTSLRLWLDQARHELMGCTSGDEGLAALEARWLAEQVTGLTRTEVVMDADSTFLTTEQLSKLSAFIDARKSGTPLARLLGWREFWGLRFALNAATLEPRPDSETLIEAALAHLPSQMKAPRIVDFGTGSGCLLASLLHELPDAQGVAVDQSAEALHMAARNFKNLRLDDRVSCIQSNWASALLPDLAGQFDLLISNPPYITMHEFLNEIADDVRNHDPLAALVDEVGDGLGTYHTLLPQLRQLAAPEALIVLEIGHMQAFPVGSLVKQHGFSVLEVRKDYGSNPRAVVAKAA